MSGSRPWEGRPLDVVIWGATGFTGELVAEQLLAKYGLGGALRWALAGRSLAKLEAVRDRLIARDGAAAELKLIVADSHDPTSLVAMTSQARVICSTVGPYLQHGADLVAACVQTGTDCCDLTGEAPFIRRMVDAHHERAAETGVRIVHACGFDSVPSDLGTLALQAHLKEAGRPPATQVRLGVKKLKGGASGGTIASMMGIVDAAAKDRELRRMLVDPYSLDPGFSGPDGRDAMGPGWSEEHQAHTAPFIMAGINTRVVRRSHALLGRPWGADFSYEEHTLCGRGLRGWIRAQEQAALLLFVLLLAPLLAAIPALRPFVIHFLPKPGEGPGRAAREAGSFVMLVAGGGSTVEVVGEGDPGYLGTSRMLSEAAVALAKDPPIPGGEGGVLTPATALGLPFVERLAQVGIRIRPVQG